MKTSRRERDDRRRIREGKMLVPRPWMRAQGGSCQRLLRTVAEWSRRVLDALRATRGGANTVVIFTWDQGDILGSQS